MDREFLSPIARRHDSLVLEIESEMSFMKSLVQLGAVTLVAGLLLAARSEAGTSEVFRLQTAIKGVTQWDLKNDPGVPRAAAVQLRDVDLINLGRGRPLTDKVPSHEHLALVTQCASNDMRIIVYDDSTQSNLVTIGNLQAVSVVESLKNKRYTRNIISELTFNFASAASNGLAGGMFFASGNVIADTNQCLISYHANIMGALGSSLFFTNMIVTNIADITVTNTITNTYLVVSNLAVNVSSSTLTAGGKTLGPLIEP